MSTIAEKLVAIATCKADIKSAIEDKGVEVGDAPLAEYANKIAEISGGGQSYTGHKDVEGLKSIGWDDEDIAQLKVCWNEEQDDDFKVTDYDKWYHGYLKETFGEDLIITDSNKPNLITTEARSCIRFMPKVNTSAVTDMSSMFGGCPSLVSIPLLDTGAVTNMNSMFSGCSSLVSIPLLDTGAVTNMSYMFGGCPSLVSIPLLDTGAVTNMNSMFSGCSSLVSIPLLDTGAVTNMNSMFSGCSSLVSIPLLDTGAVTNMNSMFSGCLAIKSIETGIKFAKIITSLQKSLTGQSLINLIKNANNTAAISQSLYMNKVAAMQVYELSCNIDESTTWMRKNDGSQSAQTWLIAQAARTDKTKSNYAITLSFESGSSDYAGE